MARLKRIFIYLFLAALGLRLPEASVGNPARDMVMRKEADICKVVIRLQGSPWNFLSMYPNKKKQKSTGFCTLLFHSSDILWKKSQIRALDFCI